LKIHQIYILTFVILAQLPSTGFGQEAPYVQHENLVYAESHGIGLLMDVFVPKGEKNGLGIVDVMSGAWHSDRGKIRDHARAQTFHILCRKGYTVFAIRPGSVTKFSVPEMRQNLNHGIIWVKDHSKEYGVDPARLGMMGASAGGHLACLAAVTADDGTSKDAQGKPMEDTRVKAVAVFFPPTDFLMYGDKTIDPRDEGRMGQLIRRLAFPEGLTRQSADEVTQLVTQISPARLVTSKAPPFLLIHGDADPVVPLQQSKVMLAALKHAGVSAELIVKPGGGHPWPTMHEEVQVLADWFDKQLAK
jgi:acetyl esterase/lipase